MNYLKNEAIANKEAVKRRFQLASKSLRPLIALLKLGYSEKSRRNRAVRPFNHAMGQVIKNAIIGEYPDLSVDYSRILLSDGTYRQVAEATVSRSGALLQLTYSMEGGKADDVVLWAILCTEIEETLALQGRRSEGTLAVTIPTHLMAYAHQHYVMVCDRNYKRFAQSQYLGLY